MPLDIVLRPHPEGLFHGKPHPLSTRGVVTSVPFEALMAEANVLLFDYPLSTAFWTALCTDRPVVFVDLDLAPFEPEIRQALARRCTVVEAQYGSDNLPRVRADILGHAIASAAVSRPDPAEFRTLLLGGP